MTDPRDDEVHRAASWNAPWHEAELPSDAASPDAAYPDAASPDAASPDAAEPASDVLVGGATVGGQSVGEPARTRRPGRISARLTGMPLRARLVLITVGLLVPALALTSAIFVFTLHGILLSNLDDRLGHSAPQVAESVLNRQFARGGPAPVDFVVHTEWTGGQKPTTERASGSDNLPVANPDFGWLNDETAPALNQPFTVGSQGSGPRWRVVALALINQSTQERVGTVYVATPMTGVDGPIGQVTLLLVLLTIGVGAAGGVLGWLAIRRSFRPLIEVEETAAAIAAGDLSRRVPERPTSTEVGRLTRSLNGMLTQIESAFRAREASEARTRRFAADASHELRTPLVSIRGFAELYRQGAVPTDEVPRTMRRIEDEAKRMGSLVEDLLLLARLDEQRPGRHEPVDLAVLAGDAVHDAKGLDPERRVTLVGLNGHGPQPAIVTGDEDRLRQVVANLVANAVRHTPAGTPVEVAVGPDGGGQPTLEVRDHGAGLTPDQAGKVFERFYRLDGSRRRDQGGGSGLGLSIVAAVVASHAGTVQVDQTPGGGATFRVSLPPRASDGGATGSARATPMAPGS